MKMILRTLILLSAAYAGASSAASVMGVPTAWRLENNIPNGVEIWYSGSSCASGRLTLPGTATTDDKNRLWSTIMAGKTSGKQVFVYYNETLTNCPITSFGLLEG